LKFARRDLWGMVTVESSAPRGRAFFRESVAGHSQQAHFDVKRDSRGGRFIHGVKAETTETRSPDLEAASGRHHWGRFFLLPSRHVQHAFPHHGRSSKFQAAIRLMWPLAKTAFHMTMRPCKEPPPLWKRMSLPYSSYRSRVPRARGLLRRLGPHNWRMSHHEHPAYGYKTLQEHGAVQFWGRSQGSYCTWQAVPQGSKASLNELAISRLRLWARD